MTWRRVEKILQNFKFLLKALFQDEMYLSADTFKNYNCLLTEGHLNLFSCSCNPLHLTRSSTMAPGDCANTSVCSS